MQLITEAVELDNPIHIVAVIIKPGCIQTTTGAVFRIPILPLSSVRMVSDCVVTLALAWRASIVMAPPPWRTIPPS